MRLMDVRKYGIRHRTMPLRTWCILDDAFSAYSAREKGTFHPTVLCALSPHPMA